MVRKAQKSENRKLAGMTVVVRVIGKKPKKKTREGKTTFTRRILRAETIVRELQKVEMKKVAQDLAQPLREELEKSGFSLTERFNFFPVWE